MSDAETSPPRRLSPWGVTWLGLLTDAVLTAARLAVGAALHSRALLADGLHGASDLITDVVALGGVRAAQSPPDSCHPYGHRRVATLTAMFIGAMLLAAAAWIIVDAAGALRRPPRAPYGPWPLAVAAACVPLKEALFRVTRSVARRTGNVALRANAWHHRGDAYSSLAAAAGLAGVAVGGPDWWWLDPATAVVLGAFLVVVAVRLVSVSAAELVDRAPDEAVLACIREVVARTEGVRSFHAFRARQVGGRVDMDVHVQVDPHLTVEQGHDIASAVKHRILAAPCDVVQVVVHIEPAETDQAAGAAETSG
jgi:cation diffusion facilitator family transporter